MSTGSLSNSTESQAAGILEGARLCRSRASTWVKSRSLSVIVVWRIVSHRFLACHHGLEVTLHGRILTS
jgi:hypothetical protein